MVALKGCSGVLSGDREDDTSVAQPLAMYPPLLLRTLMPQTAPGATASGCLKENQRIRFITLAPVRLGLWEDEEEEGMAVAGPYM